jgi:hypothetical protein
MATVHPTQPPPGVAGHSDAKPQPAHNTLQNADPYLNAGTYAAQGNYSNAPSPPPAQNFVGMPPQNTGASAPYNTAAAPYNTGAAPYNAGTAPYNAGTAPYNAGTAPYNAPVSPPPQQSSYGNDTKQQYMYAPPAGQTGTATTGGEKTQHTAELGGSPAGAAGAAPSELPSGKTTWLGAITN